MKKIKIPPISPGAHVGVVAPGSPVATQPEIDHCLGRITDWGFQLSVGEQVRPRAGFLAGTDRERRLDLERMWLDPEVAGIWCLRGGYGCLRLLPELGYRLAADHPKILVGYSDVTALELALWARIKLVTFHGPMPVTDVGEFSRRKQYAMVTGEFAGGRMEWPSGGPGPNYTSIRPGKASGILLGGNLATLVSLVGTAYLPSFAGKILFIEEVSEPDYRIDRLITQVLLSGALDDVSAVLVGSSVPTTDQSEADVIAVFQERLTRIGCPVAYGFPIGHLPEQWTVPLGVWGTVDTACGEVVIDEAPWLSE